MGGSEIRLWRSDNAGADGREEGKISGATPAQNVAHRIGFTPQGSRVFHDLTVKENLEVG